MTDTKPTKKRKTKKEKLEDELNEVEQAAKEIEQKQEAELDEDFPAFALPCRGYFRELDQSHDVMKLQAAMNHLMCANIPVTGVYDSDTVKAVKMFEEKYGGCVNGRFGKTEIVAYNKLRGVK